MLFYFENENDFGYNIEINWEKGGELERNINCSVLINFTLFCASVPLKFEYIENMFYVFRKTIFNELRKTRFILSDFWYEIVVELSDPSEKCERISFNSINHVIYRYDHEFNKYIELMAIIPANFIDEWLTLIRLQ